MSEYVKLTLAAATLALADAGVTGDEQFAADCAAVLGTTHAGAGYCVDYYKRIVEQGMAAANPMLFAEGVPNAAAAHLSLTMGLKGSCQTILGTRTAGLDALRMAYLRIANGDWDRAIVSAAEEFTPLATPAYGNCMRPPAPKASFFIGAGAVTFVLESRSALTQRNGRSRGQIVAAAGARFRSDQVVQDIAGLLKRVGSPSHVMGSANNTWIDSVESAAFATDAQATTRELYGLFPELFSVGPLASIACTLLQRRESNLVGVLCTGFSGTAAAATVAW